MFFEFFRVNEHESALVLRFDALCYDIPIFVCQCYFSFQNVWKNVYFGISCCYFSSLEVIAKPKMPQTNIFQQDASNILKHTQPIAYLIFVGSMWAAYYYRILTCYVNRNFQNSGINIRVLRQKMVLGKKRCLGNA